MIPQFSMGEIHIVITAATSHSHAQVKMTDVTVSTVFIATEEQAEVT